MPPSCLPEWIFVPIFPSRWCWNPVSYTHLRAHADYRGEICIILVNLSSERFVIEDGERIAQMVIARHEQAVWQEVDVLDETERGSGGFGHTGV